MKYLKYLGLSVLLFSSFFGVAQTVTSVSSTAANGTYKVGDVIPITVTFSANVTVTGTPQLTLETGSSDAVVNYSSGSGSNTLTFNYTVAAGHSSADLDYVATSSLALNNGTIKDVAGNVATLTLASPGASGSLGASKALAISPTVTLSSNATTIAEDGTAVITATLDYASTKETVVSFAASGTATIRTDYKGKNSNDFVIGDTYQGGLIFYLDDIGGGLVAAPSDQPSRAPWTNNGSYTTPIPGAGTAIGTGYQNTVEIEAWDTSSGTAADICANLSLGGYTDWFLPSKDEMNLMYQNIGQGNAGGLGNVGGFKGNPPNDIYWTSSASSISRAVTIYFINGNFGNDDPAANSWWVRAARTFNDLDRQITIPAGQTSAILTITGIDDAIDESDETIILTPSATGAVLASSVALNIALTDNDLPPVVTSVTSTTADGAYKEGQVIAITVTFDKVISVTGTPQLTLETGSNDAVVDYASGTGTTTLTFNYTIGSAQNSEDLDYAATTSLALNSGTITETGGTSAATLTLPTPGATNSLGANKALVIDTTVPTMAITATNGTSVVDDGSSSNAILTVTFTSSEATTDFAEADITVSGGAISNFTAVSSTVYTANFTPTGGGGAKTIDVAANTFTDEAVNSNTVADQFNWTYVVPVVTLTTDKTDLPEHQSSVITATLDYASVQETILYFNVAGTAFKGVDYNVSSNFNESSAIIVGGNGAGSSANQINGVVDLDLDAEGNIYVAEYGGSNVKKRIVKFAPGETNGITLFNSSDIYNEGARFHGLAMDASKNVHTVEVAGSEGILRKWDQSTNTITTIVGVKGTRGCASNQLGDATDVAVDASGNVYVSDRCYQDQVWQHRIQKFSPGDSEGTTVLSNLFNPTALVVDSNGNIFIQDGNKIIKGNGDVIFQADGSGGPGDEQILGINLDNNDNLYMMLRPKSYNPRVLYKWIPELNQMTIVSEISLEGNNTIKAFALDYQGNIILGIDQWPYNGRVEKIPNPVSINIPAGQTSAILTFAGIEDSLLSEGAETIILTPTSTNASLASNDAITISLLDNSITLTKTDDPFIGLSNGAVSWGDYDRDGDKDVAIMGQSSIEGAVTAIYRNDAGTFVNTNQDFVKLYDGDITWIDINKDGYLDLVVSGYNQSPQTILYLNNAGISFTQDTTANLPQLFSTKMAWGDLDLDGDIDFAMMGINGSEVLESYIGFKEIDGYKLIKDQFPALVKGALEIADIDLDGDNDLLYSGEDLGGTISSGIVINSFIKGSKSVSLPSVSKSSIELINTGATGGLGILVQGKNSTASFTAFNKGSYDFSGITTALHSGDITAGDFDNNGGIDVVITGEDDNGVATTKLYWDWAGAHEEFDVTLEGLRESTAEWVDYDMDGDLDLFLMGLSETGAKTILYKTEIVNKKNTKPAAPSNLQTTDQGFGNVKFTWDAPKDDYSSALGYVVRLGTTKGGSELSNTESDITTGARLMSKAPSINTNQYETQLDPGTYYWSVQAVDNGLKGSAFATEGSFELTYAWKSVNQGGIIDYKVVTVADPVLKMVDIDGDDDLDVLYGSQNSSGTKLLQFDGQRLVSNTESKYGFISSVGTLSDIQASDVNGDGIQDIWMSLNNGEGARFDFSLDSSFLSVAGLSEYKLYNAKSQIVDLNNDGKKEIISLGLTGNTSSSKLKLYVLELDPTASTPTLKITDQSDKITTLTASSFDFGDYDGDQDIDFLISGFSASDGLSSILYQNNTQPGGDLSIVSTTNNFVAVRDGTTDFIDFDSDGDLDIIYTGTAAAGDVFEIYLNELNEGKTEWSKITTNLSGIRNSKIDLGDFNSDGYTDIIYSGTLTGEGEVTKLSEYDPATKQYVASAFDISDIIKATVEFGDIDGDGDLDFLNCRRR